MAPESSLAELESVVANAVALISQLESTVAGLSSHQTANDAAGNSTEEAGNSSAKDNSSKNNDSINVLSLAQDSATLIKAHSTKISLLIINEPFTPTAITKVIRELVGEPVPVLASAAQLCRPERYTKVIQQELAWRIARVLKELKELLSKIPKDGKALSDAKKNASVGAAAGKGSIAATAVLWSACDDIITFAKRGFAGNLIHNVEQLRETLKDVMEELKEWGEETGEEDEEDDEDNTETDGVDEVTQGLGSAQISTTQTTQDMLDDLMNSQRYIPRNDPDKIRERLESCLRRLRLTTLLYQATVKRRLKILPQQPPDVGSSTPSRLDEVMNLLKRIPDRFGSLALAFYELDTTEIDRLMDECFFDAFAVSELLNRRWDGEKDEFTDWAAKFQVEIKRA